MDSNIHLVLIKACLWLMCVSIFRLLRREAAASFETLVEINDATYQTLLLACVYTDCYWHKA